MANEATTIVQLTQSQPPITRTTRALPLANSRRAPLSGCASYSSSARGIQVPGTLHLGAAGSEKGRAIVA